MRKLVIICSAFVLAVAMTSCSSDKDPTPAAVSVTQASAGDTLTLSAPDTLESGAVEIRFQNQAQLPVSAEVIGVEGSHTVAEVLAVTENEGAPIPSWLKPAGGLPTTEPGRTTTATVELEEGTYFVIAEADADDEEEAEPPPPVSKTLRVSGDSGASLPSADATVTAKDYSFEADGLKAGANEIRFENEGDQIHHLVAFPIAQGRTIDEVRTFLETEGEGEGPPPIDFAGGAEAPVIDSGKALVTTLDLREGKYAFVCFIQDRAGGPPHVAKGMLTEVTVG
jgi:plastocyanin